VIIHDCEQYSDEWWDIRTGIPSGSGFNKIITPKTGKLSAQSDQYIAELIDQEVDGFGEGYMSYWMERGLWMQEEAIDWYGFHTGYPVIETGFITNDDMTAGASPDGLVDSMGVVEVKAPKGSTHVKWFLNGGLPDEHKPQCHAELLLSERKWLDFVSYHPSYKPLLVRVRPDDYTKLVAVALDQFIVRLAEAKAKIIL